MQQRKTARNTHQTEQCACDSVDKDYTKYTLYYFDEMWLLDHAFRARSKRPGAYFFQSVNALWWKSNFQISAIFDPWLTLLGTGVSA